MTKIYEHINRDELLGGDVELLAEMELLDAALAGSMTWALDLATATSDRYRPENIQYWQQQIRKGALMQPPRLYMQHGQLSVMEGRSRLYALRELRYTHVFVTCEQREVDTIRPLVMRRN